MASYRAPGWLTHRLLNPVVEWLVRAGIGVTGTRVLAVKGRKSGLTRTNPVNVLNLRGVRYVVAPRGDTEWVRNLRTAGRGELRLGRQTEAFTAIEVDDEAKPPILREYVRRWGIEMRMFFDNVRKDAPEEDFRRIAPNHPVFRIRPSERADGSAVA